MIEEHPYRPGDDDDDRTEHERRVNDDGPYNEDDELQEPSHGKRTLVLIVLVVFLLFGLGVAALLR